MTTNLLSSGWQGNVSGYTLTPTVGASANGLLVSIVCYNPDSYAITAPTWNGVSMTQIAQRNQGDGHYQYIYWLATPATGSYNLVLAWAGNTGNSTYAVYELIGAAASQPESGSPVVANRGGVSPWSVNITTVKDGAIIFGAMGIDSGIALTAGQTDDYDQFSGACMLAHYTKATAGTFAWAATNSLSGGGGLVLVSIAPEANTFPRSVSATVSNAASRLATAARIGTLKRAASATVTRAASRSATVSRIAKFIRASAQMIHRICLSFDGVNDYVNVGNGGSLNITNAMTVSAWVKIGDITSVKTIVDKLPSPFSAGYFITINVASLQVYLNSGNTQFNKAIFSSSDIGVWNHVVMVGDGAGKVKVYKNGVKDVTEGTYSSSTGNTANLYISRRQGSNSQNFNGSIDEVRVYNRALSEAEVLASYQGQYVAPTGLVLDMPLHGDALDYSGNGNNGTIYGATWVSMIATAARLETFKRSASATISNAASRLATVVRLITFKRLSSASVSNAVARLATIAKQRIIPKAISASVSNSVSRLATIARFVNYKRNSAVSTSNTASRFATVSRITKFIRNSSASISNSVGRLATIIKHQYRVFSRVSTVSRLFTAKRNPSASVSNSASRLATVSRLVNYARKLSASVSNAASRLATIIKAMVYKRNPTVRVSNSSGRLAKIIVRLNGILHWVNFVNLVKHLTTFTNKSKNATVFANKSKHSTVFTNKER